MLTFSYRALEKSINNVHMIEYFKQLQYDESWVASY